MAAADFRLPSVSYTQSMWGDTFTSFSLDYQVQEKYAEAIEALKEEVRSILLKAQRQGIIEEKLVLIDTIERLGVAYHFNQEIENLIQQIKDYYYFDINEDLFTTALRFRLLRQHRHHASTSIFDKFKDEENKFKETLKSDGKGLLSLYEAAHLRIHGEKILDEAVAFTSKHLNLMLDQQLLIESPLLEDQVKRALLKPLHRGFPRVETRYYISLYEKKESKNELLLKLSKLDFNYLQNMHKQELSQISRWWSEFGGVMKDLPYARARVVEAFIWATAFGFEPRYCYARVVVSKTLQMLTLIDDTYDNYATLEEAELFTQIMERWNMEETDKLPECLKITSRFTLCLYDNYEREAAEQGKSFAFPYAKESVKQICRAYNKGMKWSMGKEKPVIFEEYIANSVFTSCFYAFCSATIPGMQSVSSKETNDWLMSEPNIIIATAKVCRYLDDLGSHERESKKGQMLTGVDYYMRQYDVSAQETADKFMELAEDAWKDLNKEWMASKNNTAVPKDIMEQVLNYARVAELYYRTGQDGFSKPDIVAPHVFALFVVPIAI